MVVSDPEHIEIFNSILTEITKFATSYFPVRSSVGEPSSTPIIGVLENVHLVWE